MDEALAAGRRLVVVQGEDGCAQLRRSQRWRGRQPGDEGSWQGTASASPVRVPIRRRACCGRRRRCCCRHRRPQVFVLVADPLDALFIVHWPKAWLVLPLERRVIGGQKGSRVAPLGWSKPSVDGLHTVACNDDQGKNRQSGSKCLPGGRLGFQVIIVAGAG